MRMPNKTILGYTLIVGANNFTAGVDLKSICVYSKTVQLRVLYGWLAFESEKVHEVEVKIYCVGTKVPTIVIRLYDSDIPHWHEIDSKKLESELQKLFTVTKIYIQCKDD